MSYIKHSKGSTEEKKIVNARVSSKTIEAINNASMLFKLKDEGKEITMSGIISQAMDEAVNQCSEDLLIDLKKLAEYKIKIETCINAINKNFKPQDWKSLMIVNDDYIFPSDKEKHKYLAILDHESNIEAYKFLKEATKTSKNPISEADLIEDPKYSIDIEYEYINLANKISAHVSDVFKELARGQHDEIKKLKKTQFKELVSNLPPEIKIILDKFEVKDFKHLGGLGKFTEIRNYYVKIYTSEKVDEELREFFYRWLWVLNSSELRNNTKKIRTVFIKQGFAKYDEYGYLNI